jgi:hypothetical protein
MGIGSTICMYVRMYVCMYVCMYIGEVTFMSGPQHSIPVSDPCDEYGGSTQVCSFWVNFNART